MTYKSALPKVGWFRSKLMTVWYWLFNLSLTAVFVMLLINWPGLLLRLRLAADNSIFQSSWLVLLVTSFLLLQTAMVHELGHLLAGYLVRFRFRVLVVGPVRVSREKDRLRLQLQRGGLFFNGLAASLPQEMDNLARRLLYVALGGPVASLLLSLVCLAGVLFLSKDLTRLLDYFWLWECCLITAVMSYFFLLTSLRPGAYHNGMMADGGRILMAATNSSQAVRWLALVKLNVADMAGKRPFQWDEAMLQQALTSPDNSQDYLSAVVMNYHHWLDKNEPQKAASYLDEALSLPIAWESGMRARLMLEKAFLAAAYLQDIAMARESFGQVKLSRHRANSLYWRTQAALYLLEGSVSLAEETAVNGLAAFDKELHTGLQKAEIVWLNNLIKKAPGL